MTWKFPLALFDVA